MTVEIIQANALALPIPDGTVDLVVTSPPYFGLRSYTDGGGHYDGQLGAEPTPAEYVANLLAATREMVRVLKPSGSIFVNLGDKYGGGSRGGGYSAKSTLAGFTNTNTKGRQMAGSSDGLVRRGERAQHGTTSKSLIGIPWRYALRCIDDLGLILRAEIIWSKPNGLPESVTDRVRRSHEQWFHFTREPRYFSAVDEIRERYTAPPFRGQKTHKAGQSGATSNPILTSLAEWDASEHEHNPLGKLPGSVWEIPTQPLTVPADLGVDHFAAFPMEWPRRIITGWSPAGVCVACGEGRRVVTRQGTFTARAFAAAQQESGRSWHGGNPATRSLGVPAAERGRTITGYCCACPDSTADTTPARVLDPFGGTGTTALVAHALGRHGISVDMSADYCRLAEWRTTDPGQLAAAMQVDKPPTQLDGQEALL